MKPYSNRVTTEFRIDICLDTNILDYYIDKEFKALNAFLDFLIQCDNFVDLFTTRYTWFELLEVRKRHHFKNIVQINLGITLGKNQQKEFSVTDNENYYHSVISEIDNATKLDLKVINDNIEIKGLLHHKIWKPTIDVCLNSRLNREDSLVVLSSLMPDENNHSDFLLILTNDRNFYNFYHSSPTMDNVFQSHSLNRPIVNAIYNIECLEKAGHNLTDDNNENRAKSIAKEFILKSIILKNKDLFIGTTDSSICPKSPEIISIKLNSGAILQENDYLVFISRDLDWFIILPQRISEFRDKNQSRIDFPINGNVGKMVFKMPEIEDEEIKNNRIDFLQEIKSTGNLVFKCLI